MYWILVLFLLICVITICMFINLNSKDEKYISDEELREVFINEYVNSDRCVLVKIDSLPKSFKIGNVYFDKCIEDIWSYQTFLSHVVIDGKIYDNGYVIITEKWNSSYRITNKDLMDYILNNLDKVEEVKQ